MCISRRDIIHLLDFYLSVCCAPWPIDFMKQGASINNIKKDDDGFGTAAASLHKLVESNDF